MMESMLVSYYASSSLLFGKSLQVTHSQVLNIRGQVLQDRPSLLPSLAFAIPSRSQPESRFALR